jgi:regulator of ribosome biosynthesis
MVSDSNAFDGTKSKREHRLMERSTENVCLLVQELFSLRKLQAKEDKVLEYTESLNAVDLPKPSTKLPREKPIPKDGSMTKWERFKRTKGITDKKKRSRLVFDEVTQDWVPRWGFKGKSNLEKTREWVIEENPKDPTPFGEDAFTRKK